ncbi:MAG: NUDIX pyrophosphatase [Lysobacteraceae bacterium]|nr:MAG: NUDIX pyrophosphatase [Xanthomonadaceae bacterium]
MTYHRQPYSVLVVVYAECGHTLLLERRDLPGFWQSVTGTIERGETAVAAAQRELLEETGIEATPVCTGRRRRFKIFDQFLPRFAPGTVSNVESEFVVCLPARCKIKLDPAEHTQYRWMTVNEAIAAVGSWTNRAALEALRVAQL